MLEKNKTKPHHFLAWGLFWISLQREIRDAPKLRMWQRTETKLLTAGLGDGCSVISGPRRCAGPCPAGCLKVTPTRPCWETTQCVCLRVLYAEGTVRWALPPLFLLLPDRLCPRAPPGEFSTCCFWTVLLFAVFSSKFVLKGPTWHRKCGCGLIPLQSNGIWARKKVLPHFRGDASVFALLPPSGGVEAEWALWLSWSPRTTQDSEGDGFCGALAMRHFFLCKPHSPQHRGEVLLLLFCRCDSGRKRTHLWVNE